MIKGRVSSLLEVGTGFHPELTGRENIYLNGAIHGMSRKEIDNKFDKIVDFAGVEKFIDTPVKHYSSGMYVRLAFAVAAHYLRDAPGRSVFKTDPRSFPVATWMERNSLALPLHNNMNSNDAERVVHAIKELA
jgi:hypothetical protein